MFCLSLHVLAYNTNIFNLTRLTRLIIRLKSLELVRKISTKFFFVEIEMFARQILMKFHRKQSSVLRETSLVSSQFAGPAPRQPTWQADGKVRA